MSDTLTKITISSTGHAYPDPVETTVRKRKDELRAGREVLLRIKDEMGTLSPFETFVLVAAVFRDNFDKDAGRCEYVFARAGNAKAAKEAEAHVRRALKASPEAEILEATFDADADKPVTALVPAAKTSAAVPVVPEIVKDGQPAAEEDGRRPTGFKYDKDFKLQSGPTPAEIRTKLIEELDGFEKGAAAARTKMKKAAAQIADAVDAGLAEDVALASYREAKAEWFACSADLVDAQDRLRSFDAKLKQDGAA